MLTDRNKRLWEWLELMEERCEEAGVPGETLCVDTLAQRRADLRAMLEENHKLFWQVRDTCVRAERAEAQLRGSQTSSTVDAPT